MNALRRLLDRFRKPQAETPPAIDPDAQPLSFEQTRSVRYWSQRDAKYRRDRPESDGFAPRGWPL